MVCRSSACVHRVGETTHPGKGVVGVRLGLMLALWQISACKRWKAAELFCVERGGGGQ